ncbi:MAG TPA: citrate synthase [Candidatus Obscuribacterales bacterium]
MSKGGLEDVVATDSSICFLDGKEGRLVYQGYDIHDLAKFSTFEETIFLLWNGRLPTKTELDALTKELRQNRRLPEDVVKVMKLMPKTALPMDVLRTSVSMLGICDQDNEKSDREANVRKATRLQAQFPTIVAHWENIRKGKEPIQPKAEGSLAANFLYMLTGKDPDEYHAHVMDVALILHADHELNASTFAGRVAAATLTDMHSAVVAAIGALKGPLHGGANQEVIKMLIEINDPAKVESYIKKGFEEHKKIMGFGHRVYKTEDPRASHLRVMSEELGKRTGEPKWFQMSKQIEELVKKEKGLYCNVDFYSASVYYMLGLPIDLFTPIFAISRVSGWTAHILEQYANNRLIRPRAEYIGPNKSTYTPIDKRSDLVGSNR